MVTNPTSNMSSDEIVRFVEGIKKQWVTAIDALVDPLMFVDKNYIIKKANKALAVKAGIPIQNVVGKTCFELFASRKTPCENCTMLKAIESGEPQNFDLEEETTENFYEVTSQPTLDADGKVDGCVQVYRDRTESKKLQKQLAIQDKLSSIGLLAGGVAHEINNPLGGILIFSQMLLKEMDKTSSHYQDVVEIELATQRCKSIVDSLLDFARQQPSKRNSKKQSVNLHEAIKSAVTFANVGLSTGLGKIQIDEDYTEEKLFVKGNKNKFVQVFLNILQNAIQAMSSGGLVEVTLKLNSSKKTPMALLEIRDCGEGIDPRDLPKIFDPFFTTKDPGEGTGLGLALSFSIITEANGTMKAESELGEGTIFTIELPLCEEDK
jgi:two-component system, NtrC family, sensor kinase